MSRTPSSAQPKGASATAPPGVVDRVNDHNDTIRALQNAHGEASAVGRTFKAVVIVGCAVGSMMLAALGLLLSIYWGGA